MPLGTLIDLLTVADGGNLRSPASAVRRARVWDLRGYCDPLNPSWEKWVPWRLKDSLSGKQPFCTHLGLTYISWSWYDTKLIIWVGPDKGEVQIHQLPPPTYTKTEMKYQGGNPGPESQFYILATAQDSPYRGSWCNFRWVLLISKCIFGKELVILWTIWLL